jgi:hypothetical protein
MGIAAPAEFTAGKLYPAYILYTVYCLPFTVYGKSDFYLDLLTSQRRALNPG